MPHLVVLYSNNLETLTKVDVLCRRLADTLLQLRAEDGQAVFPPGGIRVFAYPAPHSAIADGGPAGEAAGLAGPYAFAYLNLRMARGRSAQTHQRVGDRLLDCAKTHLEPLFAQMALGLTVQIDESPSQVYDGKHSSLHALFR